MIEVRITLEDIKNGIKGSYTDCPIALALRRAFPDSFIQVLGWSIWVDNRRYRPSREIQHFIRDFDAGRTVEPFRFGIHDESASEALDCPNS